MEEGIDYIMRSPEDGAKIAIRFIGRDDREVFKSAIPNNAASVIVAHQHPSGWVISRVINFDYIYLKLKLFCRYIN